MEPRQMLQEAAAPPDSSGDDPRQALMQLIRAVRAHAEWLDASGAWGVAARSRPEPRAGVATVARSVTPAPRSSRPEVRQADVASAAPAASSAASPGPGSASSAGGSGVERGVRLPVVSAERLEALAAQVNACTRCALHEGRQHAVISRGTGSSGLVFVGEGPGEEEDRQGLPFVGPAGQLLDRMIAAMEFDRDEVYVCNIVKCRPPKNRKPEPDEMATCMPFLAEQLELVQPRVIVALGATAVQGLLGTTEGITRMRGQWKLYRGKVPVMPTFHPAYLLRTPAAKRDVWKDLQEVLRRLRAEDAAR